jgi:hypothetical protein
MHRCTAGHGTNNREPFGELGLFIKTENMNPRPDKKGLMKLFGKSVSFILCVSVRRKQVAEAWDSITLE